MTLNFRYPDHQDHQDYQAHKDHQVSKVQLGKMAVPDDRDHVGHRVKMAKMVHRDVMVQMAIKEKQVPMDQKVAVTTVHHPELLQATKQFWWIIQENDVMLEQSNRPIIYAIITIQSSINLFIIFCES